MLLSLKNDVRNRLPADGTFESRRYLFHTHLQWKTPTAARATRKTKLPSEMYIIVDVVCLDSVLWAFVAVAFLASFETYRSLYQVWTATRHFEISVSTFERYQDHPYPSTDSSFVNAAVSLAAGSWSSSPKLIGIFFAKIDIRQELLRGGKVMELESWHHYSCLLMVSQ